MRKKLNVKALRKYLNVNQDEIAERYGVNRTTWSNYERQNNFPETLLRDLETDYSANIKELGSKVYIEEVSSSNVEALQNRIQELEKLIEQKDLIIQNQLALLEMQNKTIQALAKGKS